MQQPDTTTPPQEFEEAPREITDAIDRRAYEFVNHIAGQFDVNFSDALLLAMDSLFANAVAGVPARADALTAYLRTTAQRLQLAPTAAPRAIEHVKQQHARTSLALMKAIDDSLRAARAELESRRQ